jgi:hypothetical protein
LAQRLDQLGVFLTEAKAGCRLQRARADQAAKTRASSDVSDATAVAAPDVAAAGGGGGALQQSVAAQGSAAQTVAAAILVFLVASPEQTKSAPQAGQATATQVLVGSGFVAVHDAASSVTALPSLASQVTARSSVSPA